MRTSSTVLFSALAAVILLGLGCSKTSGGGGADGGIWKSADGGKTWAQSSVIPTAKGVSSATGTNILTLASDPSDPDAYYAGLEADGMLFTLDGGATWQQSRDDRVRQGAVTAIAVDPNNICRVYVARVERIFRTDDCNRNYEHEVYVEGKPGVYVTAIVADWFDEAAVYASLSDGSIIKTKDRGAHWSNIFRGRQAITDLLMSPSDSRVLVAAMAGSGLARTEDGGATWMPIIDQLKPYANAGRIVALAQDKKGAVMVAATAYGLLRSDDQGQGWKPLKLLTAPGEVMPSAVAVDPADGKHILYAVGSAVYETRDGGNNWSVQKLPTARRITAILFDSADSSRVFLGVRKIESP